MSTNGCKLTSVKHLFYKCTFFCFHSAIRKLARFIAQIQKIVLGLFIQILVSYLSDSRTEMCEIETRPEKPNRSFASIYQENEVDTSFSGVKVGLCSLKKNTINK